MKYINRIVIIMIFIVFILNLVMEYDPIKQFMDYHLQKIILELKQSGIELTKENILRIIEESSFRVRSKKYPLECPYYQADPVTGEQAHPCHPEVKELNCFLCACSEYKSSESIGGCNINSNKGFFYMNRNLPFGKIWDCSKCPVPHSPEYVRSYLIKNIDEIKRKYG